MTREFAASVRVRYAETDQMGVAYHAHYLAWCEIGRTELMRAVGVPYAELERAGVFMPVIEAQLRYRRPARYDDEVDVRTRLAAIGPVRVRFSYRLLRRADGVLLATAETGHAAVGGRGRPRRIPDEVKRCLLAAHAPEA